MVPAWFILVALLAPLPVAPAPPAPALPAGCSVLDDATYTCRWVFDALPPANAIVWDFPAFPRTLATFSVTLFQSPDTGWTLRVQDPGTGEEVTRTRHNPSATLALRQSSESTHVLIGSGALYALELRVGEPTSGVRTSGRYEVVYIGRAVPDGEDPSRPAATAADPHFRDAASDVEDPAWDIQSAWFGDARLDDGLMDVHLEVGDLANLTAASFRAPSTEFAGREVVQVDELGWKVAWNVSARRYYVEWWAERPTSADPIAFSCVLRTEDENAQLEEILAHPLCEVDVENGVFHATFPEASIGSPPSGMIFERMEVRSRSRYAPNGFTDTLDDRGEVLYPFALGGPAVWSALNPRLDPPPTAWYEDPLAPENVADTFQVGGSVIALTTFLVGLLLVRRRQRHTARLLARVDAVEESGIDSKDILLRLGELEQEFNVLFRRHRISDAQYQVLTQRIAGVATRFSLRRSLGLDDGTPGEQAPAAARRIPVVEGDARLRP